MPGKIPPEFIDDLLTRVDIVDVINPFVPLKKAGSEYKACCPFHSEKTPSFTVSPAKQFYHCFGCGAHGSAIRFLMEYEHLSFPEAIESLAESVGIEVPREARPPQSPDHRPLYTLMQAAADFYQTQLSSHPEAQRARDYLLKRGLSSDIIKRYQIGFAPPGWQNLENHFGAASIPKLALVGLLSEKDGRRYDRFRNRITFPILDTRGRAIGLGGRVLGNGDPKYLNSPQTPIFNKGRELYGLYQAQRSLKQEGRLLVVEGYMDVIALAQYGIPNAVATLGTATTTEHIKKLFRYTHELVFCFDGDRAGREAAWKAMDNALPLFRDGHQLRFLFLDEGEDPDSQVRKEGPEAFLKRVSQAQPLSEFLLGKLEAEVDMSTLDGRARLVSLAEPYIKKLPHSVFKDMMQQRLTRLSGKKPHQPNRPARRFRSTSPNRNDSNLSALHRAIALLLQYPKLAQHQEALEGEWRSLDSPGSRILETLLKMLRQNPNLNTAALVEHWQDDNTRQHLARLASTGLTVFEDELEQFSGCLARLSEKARKQAASHLKKKLKPSDMSEDEKKLLRQLYSVKQDAK